MSKQTKAPLLLMHVDEVERKYEYTTYNDSHTGWVCLLGVCRYRAKNDWRNGWYKVKLEERDPQKFLMFITKHGVSPLNGDLEGSIHSAGGSSL